MCLDPFPFGLDYIENYSFPAVSIKHDVLKRKCTSEGCRSTFEAVTTPGRSQDGQVWIIGETQVNNQEQIISEDMREYICIPELLNNNIPLPEVQMPLQEETLNAMLASLKSTIHHHSVGAVMAVGKKCSLHITMSQASDQRVAKGLILYQTKLYLLSGNILFYSCP